MPNKGKNRLLSTPGSDAEQLKLARSFPFRADTSQQPGKKTIPFEAASFPGERQGLCFVPCGETDLGELKHQGKVPECIMGCSSFVSGPHMAARIWTLSRRDHLGYLNLNLGQPHARALLSSVPRLCDMRV